jgi:DNA-binding IclR family transcriptional regulator
VDETEYLKQLENVKQKGYAFDDEEYIEGIRSLAVNLGNCRGLPLVIWVVGFTASLTLARLPILVQKTCQAAGALSRGCLTGCSTKNQQSS